MMEYCCRCGRRSRCWVLPVRVAVPHRLRRPSAMLLLLAAFTFIRGGSCYDYAVQPRPAQFNVIPQSQTIIKGDSILLKCNLSVIKLGSNYPVQHLEWWRNGERIRPAVQPNKNDIDRGYIYSELHIDDATKQYEGEYQCIGMDGKKKGKWIGPGQYNSSSPIATIQILSVEDFVTNETETVNVTLNYGEPYVVPCELGRVGISSHIRWFQNETLISDRSTILSNGSLLLPAVTTKDSGYYHCSIQIGNHSILSHRFLIQVNDVLNQGGPYLKSDVPDIVPLFPGDHFKFRCYILGVLPQTTPTSLQLKFLRQNESLVPEMVVADLNHSFYEINITEIGIYSCQLIQENGVISDLSVNVVKGYYPEAEDKLVEFDYETFVFTSSAATQGPYHSIQWFRDGVELDDVGLSYTVSGHYTELLGHVYQSVVVMETGVVYHNSWRIFDMNYTNPPTNLECSVRLVEDRGARVIASWDIPDYIAMYGTDIADLVYVIEPISGLTEWDRLMELKVELNLGKLGDVESTEGQYALKVRHTPKNSENGKYYSAPAVCDFNTIERAMEPPLAIKVDCENKFNFTWINRLIQNDVTIVDFSLAVSCIYQHNIYKLDGLYRDDSFSLFSTIPKLDNDRLEYFVGGEIVAPVNASASEKKVPLSAACYATGYYRFDVNEPNINRIVYMPPESCVTTTTSKTDDNIEEGVYLELDCRDDRVNVKWAAWKQTNMSLFVSCLYDLDQTKLTEEFTNDTSERFGNASLNVTNFLLCSFYGKYYDTEEGEDIDIVPVQCANRSRTNGVLYPSVVLTPTRTEVGNITSSKTTSTSSKTTSTSSTTTPTSAKTVKPSMSSLPQSSDKNYTIVLEASLPSSLMILAAILLILIILIVLKCRSNSKFNPKRIEFSLEWHEFDTNYQPPLSLGDSRGKSVSVKTIYNNGDNWEESNDEGSPEHNYKLDTGSPSEMGSDPISEDSGAIPMISPFVIVTVEPQGESNRKSGCGLDLEISSDGSGGKEHLFNKFLTEMEQDEQGQTSKDTNSKTIDGETRLVLQIENEMASSSTPSEREKLSASSSIAQMVAERLQMTADSNVPSSGYGTDTYKFSSNGDAEITPEYLARKLRDVEESESAAPVVTTNNDRLDSTMAPPTNIDLLNSIVTPPASDKTTSKIDLSLTNIVNGGGREVGHLPTLVLTPPQINGTIALSNSVSTGDLSSYSRVNEGYLDVSSLSSATNSGQTQSSHHISFDTKSL